MNIFVVIHSYGSYDDAGSWPVLTTFKKELAEKFIEDMQRRKPIGLENKRKIRNHMQEWFKLNSQPGFRNKEVYQEWSKRYEDDQTIYNSTFSKEELKDAESIDEYSEWQLEEFPVTE